MAFACRIFTEDSKGKKFEFEHAWNLLKDEPKWSSAFVDVSTKRTKVSSVGAYSSSSNPETEIETDEYDTPPTISRPIGQKAAKRKGKGKASTSSSSQLDLSSIETIMKSKVETLEELVKLRKSQEIRFEYDILMKDTSNMSEQQRADHEMYCDLIRQKRRQSK